MMLGNLQQAETLLDNLKKEKTGYRQVVEMKEKREHQTSAAASVGLLGRTGLKKSPLQERQSGTHETSEMQSL